MYKEVEIDDLNKLANFIIENEYNKIAIESPEFTDTKDLFFFCIELTLELIKILYNTSNINDLSIENIDRIKNILTTACIDFNINITELKENRSFLKEFDFPNISSENNELINYYLNIYNNNKKYSINFDIIKF